MPVLYPLFAAILAYMIGSLSFAVIVSRMMGLNDPRSYGSGNPGATNVLRSGNKKAAVLTLLFDALKGFVPTFIVAKWGPQLGLGEGTVALVGLAAFLGHLYPMFFQFKGGKGVATAAGVLFAFNPLLGLATLLTWLFVAFFTRYSSLAAILSAALSPFFHLLISDSGSVWISITVTVMAVLLIYRHAANIQKLIQGKESKIGGKKAPSAKQGAKQ